MKNFKRLVAFLLALMLAVACGACGKKGESTTTESTGKESVEKESVSGGADLSRLNAEVYNLLSEDYQFDTSYVTKNKSKFSSVI